MTVAYSSHTITYIELVQTVVSQSVVVRVSDSWKRIV